MDCIISNNYNKYRNDCNDLNNDYKLNNIFIYGIPIFKLENFDNLESFKMYLTEPLNRDFKRKDGVKVERNTLSLVKIMKNYTLRDAIIGNSEKKILAELHKLDFRNIKLGEDIIIYRQSILYYSINNIIETALENNIQNIFQIININTDNPNDIYKSYDCSFSELIVVNILSDYFNTKSYYYP